MQLVYHSCKPGLAQEQPLHLNLAVVDASPGKLDGNSGTECCNHCRNQNSLHQFLFPFPYPGLLLDLVLLLLLVFLQLYQLPLHLLHPVGLLSRLLHHPLDLPSHLHLFLLLDLPVHLYPLDHPCVYPLDLSHHYLASIVLLLRC